MYEAYAAALVGVVCAAVAISALNASRHLSPLPYATVHVTAMVVMIALITLGYTRIPVAARYPQIVLSNAIYIGTGWLMFVATLLTYSYLNRPKRSTTIQSERGLR